MTFRLWRCFLFLAAQLTGRGGGGGPLVGPKAQVFPKIIFDGTPNHDDLGDQDNSKLIIFHWQKASMFPPF